MARGLANLHRGDLWAARRCLDPQSHRLFASATLGALARISVEPAATTITGTVVAAAGDAMWQAL